MINWFLIVLFALQKEKRCFLPPVIAYFKVKETCYSLNVCLSNTSRPVRSLHSSDRLLLQVPDVSDKNLFRLRS